MNNDFVIDIQESTDANSSNVQLPLNFLSFGEIENDDVKVYIKQDVYKALEKYALQDVEHERGTIILGDYAEELGKTHVIISNYIEAKYTDASASTLTFTHETWDYVHKEHDAKFSDKKIVGWQHTHPSYGIFLSNYDLFIQENFFNMPFQVAYVIDPIQSIRGFFQWKNGKIEKLKGFYIYDDVGKQIKIETNKAEKGKQETVVKPSKVLYSVIALLCVLTTILGISAISINNKYSEQQKAQEKIIERVDSQEEIINNQNDTIAQLQEQLVNGLLDEDGKTTAKDLIAKIESHEITLQNQEEILGELKAFVEKETEDESVIKFKAYTVQPGDTLTKICNSAGIDYSANSRIILSINGIENANQIFVGQIILLPLKQ